MPSLARQNPIEVAVERHSPALGASATRIAFRLRTRHEWAERARRLAGLGGPVQSVVLARAAGEALRVFEDAGARMTLGVVLALRVDVREADLDDAQLVAADPTSQDLLAP